jgi:ubiquinol-cytochrome c reductase cytochrome c subunit
MSAMRRLLPALFVVLALGLALGTSTTPSSAAGGEEPHTGKPDTKASPPDTAVGSGQDNLYNPGSGLPETADPGTDLYIRHCSSCHGIEGEGSNQGPSLIGVGEAAVDFYVSTGRMPLRVDNEQAPRGDVIFTREQIDEIIEHVGTFGPGPEIPKVDLSKGDLVKGNELYANNCAACHNSSGSGGALSADYYAPNLFDATPVQVAEAIRVGPGAMPKFGENTFSEEELDSLVKYVEYLRTAESPGGLAIGKYGPVAEGFVAWVVGLGALLALSRWMGTRV